MNENIMARPELRVIMPASAVKEKKQKNAIITARAEMRNPQFQILNFQIITNQMPMKK
jgi:hypothetical protein